MEKRAVKESRIEARIPSDLKKHLARAAALQGRTLSDFVVSAAAEAVRRTIEEDALLRLCEEDSRALALDLCAPEREPSPRLRVAAARYDAAKQPE
jgi:uncharacterized protein (DUF1778 family)